MQIINTKQLPSKHRIILAGDQHIGTKTCDLDVINGYIKRIQSGRNNYGMLLGDLADAIESRDKRFSLDEHAAMPPVKQYATARKMHEPIADKILAAISGNHDYKLSEHGTGDFVQQFCEDLGHPEIYGDYACAATVNVEDGLSYSVYLWHGAGSPPRAGFDNVKRDAVVASSVKKKLQQQFTSAHVMAMGHIHKLAAFRPQIDTAIYVNNNDFEVDMGESNFPMDVASYQRQKYINPDDRWYAVTGTAKRSRMKGIITYEERMGFGSSDLGWVELVYDNGKLWLEKKFYYV